MLLSAVFIIFFSKCLLVFSNKTLLLMSMEMCMISSIIMYMYCSASASPAIMILLMTFMVVESVFGICLLVGDSRVSLSDKNFFVDSL